MVVRCVCPSAGTSMEFILRMWMRSVHAAWHVGGPTRERTEGRATQHLHRQRRQRRVEAVAPREEPRQGRSRYEDEGRAGECRASRGEEGNQTPQAFAAKESTSIVRVEDGECSRGPVPRSRCRGRIRSQSSCSRHLIRTVAGHLRWSGRVPCAASRARYAVANDTTSHI